MRQYCSSRGKRLPTDAEWEFAARGKTKRFYRWGDAPPACAGKIDGRTPELPCAELGGSTGDVGASPQDWTPEGVHDLFGNASEWLEDAYVAPYLLVGLRPMQNSNRRTDGHEPTDERVVRGNAWLLDDNFGEPAPGRAGDATR